MAGDRLDLSPAFSAVPDSPETIDRRRFPSAGDSGERRRRNAPSMSVIVPTYNEAGNVAELVARLKAELQDQEYEVIIVDDDSPDGTWKVASELAAPDPRFSVIRRTTDRGLSSAVLTGMAVAKGSVLVVMDGDLQHDPAAIVDLVTAVQHDGVDIAVASRNIDGGSYGEFGPGRRLISWTGAQIAETLLRTSVSDPMSGFFALSRSRYDDVVAQVNPRGFKILLEFLARGGRPTVTEVGYRFGSRTQGTTKLSTSVVVAYLLAMIELSVGRFVSATFLAYSLVGLFGLAVRSSFQWLLSQDPPAAFVGPQWAVLLAVEMSIVGNYLVHNLFTFTTRRHVGRKRIRGLAWFHLVSGYGLLVHAGAVALLGRQQSDGKTWSLVRLLAVEISPAFLFGMATALIVNYHLNSTVTWRRRA